jgi:hypothetical protein
MKSVETPIDTEVSSGRKDLKQESGPAMKYVALDDGRLTPIEADGMVDVAISEMGAIVVDVETHSVGDDFGSSC